MLEIILVVNLTRRLAALAERKGRSKMWGGLLVAGWIVGEVLGFVLGFAMEMEEIAAYGMALVGALIGAGAAWAVVAALGEEQPAFAPMADGGGVGQFDPENPYSPPGTYPSTAR